MLRKYILGERRFRKGGDARQAAFALTSPACTGPSFLSVKAQMIRHNLDEFGESISAVSHVQYINREAAFRKKGGCIYTSHRLPKWATDDPKRFFRVADRYERKDGNWYFELQMALPNELPPRAHPEFHRAGISGPVSHFHYLR